MEFGPRQSGGNLSENIVNVVSKPMPMDLI